MDTVIALNGSMVCVLHKAIRCKGIFLGDNPFNFATPVILCQLSICAFFAALFTHWLTPLGQTTFFSQILVGVVIGPSSIGKHYIFKKIIFAPQSFYVGDTLAFFGVMLFLFIVGAKTDLGIMRRPGKKAITIGVCTFFLPLILNLICARTLRNSIKMSPHLNRHLYWIAILQSLSNFHVIACFLGDLKLLNTEVGRLAVSSSMVSGCCSWFFIMVTYTARQSQYDGKNLYSLVLAFFFVFVIICIVCCILRPIMLRMVHKTSNENVIKESYVVWVFIMVLGVAFFGEVVGQHFLFGPMLLGLAVPNGPPLGSALVTKLDSFVSRLLLPLYFMISGARIDFQAMQLATVGIVQLLAFLGLVWKVIGVMLTSLYWQIPFSDSLYLGLIMSSQGIVDVLIFSRASTLKLIDRDIYSIMVLCAIILTGIVSPIVKFLYKPTKRYVAYKRTIQHAKPFGELRLLACIPQESHTPSIINLLEATYPNARAPICIYILHLIDLQGRSAPVLEAHLPGKRHTSQSHESYHIINAFRLYEQQKHGNTIVYPFTVISPYSTMYEDVCGLALEKRVCLVILPFYTLNTIHRSETTGSAIRAMNRNILKLAPCSVGILIDRGSMNTNIHLTAAKFPFYVCVLFVGGQDDREALSLGRRMAKNPNVGITVVHLVEGSENNIIYTDQDNKLINEFKYEINMKSRKCVYREEVVNDSVDVVSAIRSIENKFDLILVGRRHSHSSALLEGFTGWNEFPELGFMGDMLASSDTKCTVSVLVLQQQAFGGEETLDISEQDSNASFHISSNSKVVPIF